MPEIEYAYLAYIERRRARGPEPELLATLELTRMELAMLLMFVANENNIVHVPQGVTQEEAGDAWSSFQDKLARARFSSGNGIPG